MNYKLTIQYDGTRYKGWQGQHTTDLTIQGKIEDVLTKMTGCEIDLIGSGRTDAGVHACGQVANFHWDGDKTEEEILSYVNQYLPEDIAVVSVEAVDERFHSRYQAVKKTYCYRIHTSAIPNVFERRYVYDHPQILDIGRMQQAASYLTGTHDFRSFCGNRKMKKSTVRTIYEIRFEQQEGELRIYYTGNGFLQNMVRILTGTLIEIGDGRSADMLEQKDRMAAGYTAPACGLILYQVTY